MNRIAVLTSGGDSPGMNATVRAVVRSGLVQGREMFGVRHGYTGLIQDDFLSMDARSVANIIQRGGTILKTDRCDPFHSAEGRGVAAKSLKKNQIDGLVVIGGDGSFRGAHLLFEEHDIPLVGIPGTIDNDIIGTDWTIGFDTAVNTALEAIDRIRDTAAAHERLFLVEVMGRHSGFLGLYTGLAGGAEVLVLPEEITDIRKISKTLLEGLARGKSSGLVVVSEGDDAGGAFELARNLGQEAGLHPKVVILGHVQRGGNPTARDRILASRLGVDAVNALLEGVSDVMCGEVGGVLKRTSLHEVTTIKRDIDHELLELGKIISL